MANNIEYQRALNILGGQKAVRANKTAEMKVAPVRNTITKDVEVSIDDFNKVYHRAWDKILVTIRETFDKWNDPANMGKDLDFYDDEKKNSIGPAELIRVSEGDRGCINVTIFSNRVIKDSLSCLMTLNNVFNGSRNEGLLKVDIFDNVLGDSHIRREASFTFDKGDSWHDVFDGISKALYEIKKDIEKSAIK